FRVLNTRCALYTHCPARRPPPAWRRLLLCHGLAILCPIAARLPRGQCGTGMRVELYFLLVACAMLLAWYWPRWRKRRLLARPFPPEWQELLEDYLPWYPQMSAEEQQRLRERMLLFLDHKQFHPCGGMELDESMR